MKKTHLVAMCALAVCTAGASAGAFAKGGPGFALTQHGVSVDASSAPARPRGGTPVCVSPAAKTSNGEAFSGDPNNSVVLLNIGAGNSMTGAAADATVTANTPSWLSETTVMFSSSDLADPNAVQLGVSGTDAPGVETVTTDGVLLFADFKLGNIPAGPDGILRLEWFETFDDKSVDPDATWTDSPTPVTCNGIYITCTDQAACDAAVGGGTPEPTGPVQLPTLSQWAFGVMIAGLGLLAFRKRREFARQR